MHECCCQEYSSCKPRKMDFFKPLRKLVPELLDSPSLTRVGRIQRAALTGLLLILPILHAVGQRVHNLSEFECTTVEFTFVEWKASDETTTLCHEEYLRSFPIACLEFFLVFMWLNLLILWLYSSYVSDRLELWRALLKAKDHKRKASELKSLCLVFSAYVSQLCMRFLLNVIFLVFHVWSSAIFAPSSFDCHLSSERDRNIFTTRASCKNGHALEDFFVNNSILLLSVLCAFSTLIELHLVWRTSERSDYYFCLLLLKENEVQGTKYLIERELFFEEQLAKILAASRHGVRTPFPTFSPSNAEYVPVEMFIRYEKTKHSSQKHLKEEFRSYAKTTVIKLDVLGDIFKPSMKPQAVIPKKILLTGVGGIGKTTVVSEIVRKWMEESGDINFTFAFFFSCMHMRLLKEYVTLKELLEHSTYCYRLHETLFGYILRHPESVLLVFDGLDELDTDAAFGTTRRLKQKDGSLDKLKLPASEWYLKLAGGHILPEATVLTTARTSGGLRMEDLEHVFIPDRKIEIHGFKREGVQVYVHNFFDEDVKMADEVNKLICQNCTLEALCYTPIFCFLTCLCLWNFVEGGFLKFGPDLPSTMTEVCERVIDIFLHTMPRHSPNYTRAPEFVWQFSEGMEIALQRLSLLATRGIQNDELVFTRDDLDAVGLEEGQPQLLVQTGFLRSVPTVADSTKHFCFNHAVIQEFLAARRIAIGFSPFEFSAFLQKVDEMHYLILQFVAGLCKQEGDGDEGETMMAHMIDEFLEAKVQQSPVIDQAMIDVASLPLFCTCLFEVHSALIPAKVVNSFQANHVIFANVHVPIYNLMAVLHVVGQVPSVTKLTLQNCNLDDNGFRLLLPSICQNDSSLTSLSLHSAGLTDSSVLALLDSAASTRIFPLKVLSLRGNSISCDGARHLACLLFNDWCDLEELYLGKNKIGHLGVNYLSESLCGESCKVHTLDISSNGLTSRAMGSLSNALSTASCSVKTLYLMHNKLGDAGFGHLCEALASDDCRLHVVLVSGNGITDRGVRFLRKPLSNTSCKLQELYLGYNHITDDGVKYMLALLSTYWSYLRVLSLARNPLTDRGVNMLARALRYNTCNLERLHISLTRTTADKRGSKLQVRYV